MRIEPLSTLGYPNSELVLGLVYAVGTNNRIVQDILEDHIKKFRYTPNTIRLSSKLKSLAKKLNIHVRLEDRPEYKRISSRMDAGNAARAKTKRGDLLALAGVAEISKQRKVSPTTAIREVQPKTAHILLSLKRPEEVVALRRIYGPGFFAIAIFASEQDRLKYLIEDMNISDVNARKLIERDQEEREEKEPFGQRTRDTFQLADVFVREGRECKEQIWRFLDLVFGDYYKTPTEDENAMFLAYSASLRSASLARQVGAAITNGKGEIIGVGCNDVPRAGGGLYWPSEEDQRDHVCREDSNDKRRDEIIADIMHRLRPRVDRHKRLFEGKRLLDGSPLMDITEFGRAVHAEMEAILSCARAGVSPQGGTLYTTTFPCHNCTRHIVAAGLRRVVYVEPYPKSRALLLHSDSIRIDGEEESRCTSQRSKVVFEPFVGVGPRRYFDLFSMRLSTGYPVKRKTEDGKVIDWDRNTARLRVPMLPTSYLQREQLAVVEFFADTKQKTGGQ